MQPGANSLWMMLDQAGWTMYPLYLCSFAALAVFLKKALEFWHHRVMRLDALAALEQPMHVRDLPDVEERWRQDGSPLGRVLAQTAHYLPEGRDAAKREATRTAVAELDRWERWIPLLAFIAEVAPLFGLLGTVIGMVDLFSSMEAAGAAVNSTTLSGGIWKALLTTAAGLIIAIPALGAHLWFTRRLDLLRHRMEAGVGRLLDRVQVQARPVAPVVVEREAS